MPADPPRIAFVHEWLTTFAGSEKTLAAAMSLFPDAPLYTLVHDPAAVAGTELAKHPVRTSFLQRMPGSRRRHRWYLPLMPLAVEQLDLRGYDVVFTSSHAVAKGVLTRADQLHISYIYTPMRYAWDLHFDYLQDADGKPRRAPISRAVLHYLRLWDLAAAQRPDVLVADSRYIARRIAKVYRRRASVIYPPVEVDRFAPAASRDDFYLVVSRLVPYKRVELIVKAMAELRRPLVVIGDGPSFAAAQAAAGPTTVLMGARDDQTVRDHMQRCRAFLMAADEDFGIAPVEAMAAGAPVIAYARGGALETVADGTTGLFFADQTVEGVKNAVREFERREHSFRSGAIVRHAAAFSTERFKKQIHALIHEQWSRFAAGNP